jgi:hypothetical protein
LNFIISRVVRSFDPWGELRTARACPMHVSAAFDRRENAALTDLAMASAGFKIEVVMI